MSSLFICHILNKFYLGVWFFKLLSGSSAHQHECCAVFNSRITLPSLAILDDLTFGHELLLVDWNISESIDLCFEHLNVLSRINFNPIIYLFVPFD